MKLHKKIQDRFDYIVSKDADGYDVRDFRVGTIIGTTFLFFVPIVNYFFHDVIPDNVPARNFLIFIQLIILVSSHFLMPIKKWANEIGNLFSLFYAALVTTVAYINDFQTQETAYAMLIVFTLCGMFNNLRMMKLYMLLTCSYLLCLIAISDIKLIDKQFLTIIAIPFFSIGYYIFSLKLNTLERLEGREKQLEQQEAWFRNIFENAPVGIVLLDSRHFAFKFNNHFQKLTGYTEGELMALGIQQLMHPEDILYGDDWVQHISQPTMRPLEQRILTKEGKPIWTRCTMSKMTLANQNYIITMFTDITTEKIVELQLRDSAKQLTAHNEALEEFSYVISHDLQEPLRMITSFTQIIQKRYLVKIDDEQAATDFAFVIDGAKRMSLLIKDMLEYSRWSAKALPVERVDTRKVLADTLQNLTVSLNNSKAEVITGNLPIILTSRVMLGQVFQNLIANAARYRHPDREPIIEINVEQRLFDVVFSIKDNGMGMEDIYQDRIFGIFQRLHPEKSTGSGMGLAICKRVIEKQGGRIWVESTIDVGSTFYFTLPSSEINKETNETDENQPVKKQILTSAN